MYKQIIKPLLFLMSPEKAHHFVAGMLRFWFKVPGVRQLVSLLFVVKDKRLERQVFGLTFPNPVGLAAGFDKDAIMFNELSYLGFGFIEIGTVTPKAQPGNEQPRMFRLPADAALINRMGFNNSGAQAAAEKLKHRTTKAIIGGNIGKNKITPNEEAVNDYIKCFDALFDVVDYFVVNVSSPNTPGLRALQDKEPLMQLLQTIQNRNAEMKLPKSVLLKIAPDLTNEQLDEIIEIVITTKLAGVVATNTTIERAELQTNKEEVAAMGAGGLSGKPVAKRSTEVIRYLKQKSNNAFPVIGVGGIHSSADAIEKLNAGADLIQVYTGFIYEGPALIKDICKEILKEKLS